MTPPNFAGLTSPYSDLETARVVILSVPYDGTSEWHRGSRHGPQAIIEASEYLEFYDIELDKETHKIGIHTLPERDFPQDSPEKLIEKVTSVTTGLIDNSKFVVTLGGEHTVTLGTVKAFRKKYTNMSVLQLDAHADLRDEYTGQKIGQATVMRRTFELCPITQVGIRSLSLEEKKFIDRNKLRPFFSNGTGLDRKTIKKITESLTKDVYITIDMDVFDPSIMPAVGLPEPEGLYWHDVLNLVKHVKQNRNIIGIDFMELCPEQGPAHCSFLTAKLVYKIIGYLFNN